MDIKEVFAYLGIALIIGFILFFGVWCFTQVASGADFRVGLTKSTMSASVPLYFTATTSRDSLFIITNAARVIVNSTLCK